MKVSPDWLTVPDAVACFLLVPLTVWILFSGLDDLIVDIAGYAARLRDAFRLRPSRRAVLRTPQRRIAIFVPCWGEYAVIGAMIARNREHVRYTEREFFIGVYPNDAQTIAAVQALAGRYADVHLALCPHDGPTSKADCLNWIYQRMLLAEAERGVRFEIVVTHDAEDVIHPDSLHWINWHSERYDMVQIPVLPLRTPVNAWTHGVYCDEFAEYQARDMPARQFMGAFVPSNGVGTGFRREALDSLAAAESNRIFEPVCLTEDYENGLRLKLRGATQVFARAPGVATREYFPQTFSAAVKQKTRWVTGIALQTWDRHGWRGSFASRYWLWRDRKGLIGNPASLLSNLLFGYGAITLIAAELGGWRWGLEETVHRLAPALGATAFVGLYRLLYRAVCVAPHYGWLFAAAVPVRVIVANCVNSLASVRALHRFVVSKMRGEPLRWVKTEHQYPTAATLAARRRKLGEILVGNGYITREQLEQGLRTQPPGRRIGEHLIDLGVLDEESLYEALSLQHELPQGHVDPDEIRVAAARCLPARVSRDCRVVPFRVEEGSLWLAASDAPTREVEAAIRTVTGLRPRFWLVTPGNFAELAAVLAECTVQQKQSAA